MACPHGCSHRGNLDSSSILFIRAVAVGEGAEWVDQPRLCWRGVPRWSGADAGSGADSGRKADGALTVGPRPLWNASLKMLPVTGCVARSIEVSTKKIPLG